MALLCGVTLLQAPGRAQAEESRKRFEVRGDDVVFDGVTGSSWLRRSSSPMGVDDAWAYCAKQTAGGLKWEVPSREALQQTLLPTAGMRRYLEAFPDTAPDKGYWFQPRVDCKACALNFKERRIDNFENATFRRRALVRCVHRPKNPVTFAKLDRVKAKQDAAVAAAARAVAETEAAVEAYSLEAGRLGDVATGYEPGDCRAHVTKLEELERSALSGDRQGSGLVTGRLAAAKESAWIKSGDRVLAALAAASDRLVRRSQKMTWRAPVEKQEALARSVGNVEGDLRALKRHFGVRGEERVVQAERNLREAGSLNSRNARLRRDVDYYRRSLCVAIPMQLSDLAAEEKRMRQVDRASGTRNLLEAREIAEERIELKEQRGEAKRGLRELGVPFSEARDCKAYRASL